VPAIRVLAEKNVPEVSTVVVRGRRAICLLTYTGDKAMNYLHLLASILVERHDRNSGCRLTVKCIPINFSGLFWSGR